MIDADFDKKDVRIGEYNEELTKEHRRNPKDKVFVNWCLKHGMRWTGLDFPAIFGDGLRGVVASRDIKPYEAVLFVPNKLLITVKKAKEDRFLGSVIEKHPEMFSEIEDADYNILILFLLRERIKGKEIMKMKKLRF